MVVPLLFNLSILLFSEGNGVKIIPSPGTLDQADSSEDWKLGPILMKPASGSSLLC